MRKVVIRNIGPIKSVSIHLNKVNIFIGPQGSGKSTIAKIISFCSWMEKVNETTEHAISEGVIESLGSFHHMKEYFNEKSSLLYVGENVAFAYNWQSDIELPKKFFKGGHEQFNDKEIVFYSRSKEVNPKVIYIPAERNFVSAVPSLKDYSENDDNLQSFVNDWFEAKRHYTKESPMPLTSLGIDFFYSKNIDIDYIALGNKSNIPLTSASSGIQSFVPLAVLVKWLSSGLYETNKPFSPAESQKVREIFMHLSGRANENEAELIERLRGFIQGRIYTHTQFIIEEPEQNLFPKTQMDLLYFLLSEINHGRNHHLVITTHSPYILYAVNNCLLAYLVKDNLDEDVANYVKCIEYAVNPADVSVWSLKDGCVRNERNEPHKTIQDKRGLIRKNYFNDVMKEVIGDFNSLLPFLE